MFGCSKKILKVVGLSFGVLALLVASIVSYQAQAYASEKKSYDIRTLDTEEITKELTVETKIQEESQLNEITQTQLQTEVITVQDTQQTTAQMQEVIMPQTVQECEQSSQLNMVNSSIPVAGVPLTDEQGQVLASQNAAQYAEQVNAVVNLTNEYRAQNGLAPLQINGTLTQAAMFRAAEMAHMENGSSQVSHTRPNGSSFSSVVNIYDLSCSTIGENILDVYDTAQSATNAWYQSETHKENMLGNYTNIGVGVAVADNGIYYWVQLFTN